ncbi:NAD-dependent epimerase/dehydratase family protein [Patescibacteria group bacterium]
MRIGILGAGGLVGSGLVKHLSKKNELVSITRNNYSRNKNISFDLLINANGNSKRYWALHNIYQDFVASTDSVYRSLFDFDFKKYIYISSVDVYPHPHEPKTTLESGHIDIYSQNTYGFHKYISEQLVRKHTNNWVILRLSSVLGAKLKKGPLYDAMRGKKVFVTTDSKIQYVSTESIANIIDIVHRKYNKKIFNVGGKGVFSFKNISRYVDSPLNISPDAGKQIYCMDVKKISKVYLGLKSSNFYVRKYFKSIGQHVD